MAGPSLFGDRPPGAITIVEAPLSRSYARKARIAFFVVTPVVAVLVSASASLALSPLWALVLGLWTGVVCGCAVAVVVRAWPVLRVLWHWGAEVTIGAAVVGSSVLLANLTHPLVAAGVLLVAAGVLGLTSSARRRVVAWGWCAVVRHRLRLCFAEFIRSANRARPGSLPLILAARPTPAGERVWVWLRPGLDLTDLEDKTSKLAVACWAGQARVVRASERYAALIRVDITRRDPLAVTVASPLLRLVPDVVVDAPVSAGMPPTGLDLPDVPEVMLDPRAGARR